MEAMSPGIVETSELFYQHHCVNVEMFVFTFMECTLNICLKWVLLMIVLHMMHTSNERAFSGLSHNWMRCCFCKETIALLFVEESH